MDVFRALADESRRALLDRLGEVEEEKNAGLTLRELCAGLDMTRQSVSKHLAVLEEAGLITTVRRGREKLHRLNAAPISDIAARWISRHDRRRADALADLKKTLEGTPMSRSPFVYVTYIRTTPERLWQGLTDPAFTRQYWGTALESDWRPGSPVTWRLDRGDTVIADPGQVVLEAEPFRRLSYTWHAFTGEWAAAYEIGDDHRARLAAEPRSMVTFEIEPNGDHVRLTVTHEGGEALLEGVSEGWPQLMASLKSLLETGKPL